MHLKQHIEQHLKFESTRAPEEMFSSILLFFSLLTHFEDRLVKSLLNSDAIYKRTLQPSTKPILGK
jgi:hypothetical protein